MVGYFLPLPSYFEERYLPLINPVFLSYKLLYFAILILSPFVAVEELSRRMSRSISSGWPLRTISSLVVSPCEICPQGFRYQKMPSPKHLPPIPPRQHPLGLTKCSVEPRLS